MTLLMQAFWILGLSIVTLGIGFWLYWKRMKPYEKFPTFPFLHYVLCDYLFGRRHIPVTASAFQRLVEFSKRYERDGVFLVWILEPLLFIFSEEAVKIFSNEKAAIDKSCKYEMMKEVFGEGTVTSNGDTWRKRRKMFNPVFYKDMLKSKVSTCNKHASMMIQDLAKVTNTPVYLLDYIKKCSAGIICETILGLKIHEERNKEFGPRIIDIVTKLCEYTIYRMIHPLMRYRIALSFSAYGRECLKWYKARTRLISEILLEWKESTSSLSYEQKNENQVGKSFAHVLIEHHLKDPTFTMKDMGDEISTYVASGYDTVSYSMMWTLFLLGHYQDIQNRVFEEVQSKTQEFITYDDTCSLKYLECVMKESMRLYPPVPIYSREVKEDVQCGKYKVPKGTSIAFFPYRLHRNSEVFPDPENFNPDRFLDGTVEKHPWAYIPFSEGIRSCIGKKFALMEMKIILAYIIRNYQIKSLDERESVELNWEVTLLPMKPLYMQLSLRKSQSFMNA